MALINCPECGKEISDKASHCIHCGCPINQPQETPAPTPKYNNTEFDSSKFRLVDGARSLGGENSNNSKPKKIHQRVGLF